MTTERRYTSDHEWVDLDGDTFTVGITDFAAEALGDLVYVHLPDPGARVEAGQPCGELESTKSVSDLVAPAGGEVLEVNSDVVADPALVTADAFGRGWLLRMRADDPHAAGTRLLDADGYAAVVAGAR